MKEDSSEKILAFLQAMRREILVLKADSSLSDKQQRQLGYIEDALSAAIPFFKKAA